MSQEEQREEVEAVVEVVEVVEPQDDGIAIPQVVYWGDQSVFAHLALNHQENIELQTEYLRSFWKAQLEEVRQITLPRVQALPPKRIRRIVKCEEDVANSGQRIAKEVVELFGKAVEMFISELTLVAWMNVPASKKVVQLRDISSAVASFHSYDFLLEFVPHFQPRSKRGKKRATTTALDGAVAGPSNGIHEADTLSPTQEVEEQNETHTPAGDIQRLPPAPLQHLPTVLSPLTPLNGPHIPSIAQFNLDPTTHQQSDNVS